MALAANGSSSKLARKGKGSESSCMVESLDT